MKHNHGFTLMELMIVVAIVAIATAFGIPAYQGYIQKADRATLQAELLEAASAMERFKTQNFTYTGAVAALIVPLKSPNTSATSKYTIAAVNITNSGATYEITATSTLAFDKTKTEVLMINNSGQRCISALTTPAPTSCSYTTDKSW